MKGLMARLLCTLITRTGAKVFYVILGLGLVVLGTFLTLITL